jgi:hypothetical protein
VVPASTGVGHPPVEFPRRGFAFYSSVRAGYFIDSKQVIFVIVKIHPHSPVEFPRRGFAFLGYRKMVMQLIQCVLADLVFG